MKFLRPQDISGASQQNSVAALDLFLCKLQDATLIGSDIIYTLDAQSSSSTHYRRGAR